MSIVEETVRFPKLKNMRKVGMVSTSATVKNKLYENAFALNNIGYVSPSENQQLKMGGIIVNLVNGFKKETDKGELVGIIDSLSNKGIDRVILACTDLQLLSPQHPILKIYDTMKILADSTVEEILK